MSVKTTPAQHQSNLRNVYGTFAIEGMTISKDLQKTAISSSCFSRRLLPESLMFCWCSCLTVWVGVTTKHPLSWNGSRSKGSRSGA